MTRHISDVIYEANGPRVGGSFRNPSLAPPDDEPENPDLTIREVMRADALGLTPKEAHHAKLSAYQAEAERFGAESITVWLKRRPSMQRAGLVPSGPPAWPLDPEPTVEDLARRNGMSVDRYVGMQGVQNIDDFERLEGELARKAEVEAAARTELEVERAKRRIAAERSGDEAA